MIQEYKNRRIEELRGKKIPHLYIILFFYSLIFLPTITFAFFVPNLQGFVDLLLQSFNIILPILNGLAFVLFFYGMAKFILAAGDAKEIVAGKQFMIYGVLALFVLVSFWGIMNFLSAQFGFNTTGSFPFLPTNSVDNTSSSDGTPSITTNIIYQQIK